MNAHVDTAIKSSSKGQFLVGCLECDDEGALAHQSLHFQHYLQVPFSEHRNAFTQMLLADHSLAEVRLQYAERYRPAVPLMWRLCRFCEENVEDPPHALFGCNGCLELQLLRDAFLNEATERCPILHLVTLSATPESFFMAILPYRQLADLLAKYCYGILQVFGTKPILIVDASTYQTILPVALGNAANDSKL